MNLLRRLSASTDIPQDAKGAVIALGNFDGVHLGHQAVIAAARETAARLGAPLAAAAFEPHPRRFFQPNAPPFRVQKPDQRARAMEALGVEALFEISFDAALAQLSDGEFARDVLAARLGARHVAVGSDFRFGQGRMGDAASLERLGATYGFSIEAVAAVVSAPFGKIGSTAIRAMIHEGEMKLAGAMLGRPWAIEGPVLQGFQRGRTIGVPTANVSLSGYATPRLGVYAVRVNLFDGAPARAGVANVGVNPTVGTLPEPLLEAHIFDFDGDLYGRTIETQLIAFMRAEEKFDGVDAMARQIARDMVDARALLA